MDYKSLGRNIRIARREKGITQEVLAELCNLSPVFISQIENGMRKPSLETVDNIARTLNSSIDRLIYGRTDSVDDFSDFESLLRTRTPLEREFSLNILKTILDGLHQDQLRSDSEGQNE